MQKVKSVFPNGGAKKTDLINCIKVKYNNLENQSAELHLTQESTEEIQRGVPPQLKMQKRKDCEGENDASYIL